MNPVSIARQALAHQGALPSAQIRAFVRREAGMVCPRVAVLEPEKVARHARMLIEGTYERELARLSAEMELAGADTQTALPATHRPERVAAALVLGRL